MWTPFLGQEDPLEEGMATPSSILAWRIPWTTSHNTLSATQRRSPGEDFLMILLCLRGKQGNCRNSITCKMLQNVTGHFRVSYPVSTCSSDFQAGTHSPSHTGCSPDQDPLSRHVRSAEPRSW